MRRKTLQRAAQHSVRAAAVGLTGVAVLPRLQAAGLAHIVGIPLMPGRSRRLATDRSCFRLS